MQRVKFLVLSILSILNVVFIPTFDVWGGLFPRDIDCDFFYAIKAFLTDKDSWSEWVVIFSLAIFIPSILMLITSFGKSKTGFLITSLLGLMSELGILALYILQNEIEEVIPSDDCSIAIGIWIALLLFIVSFIIAIKSKKKTEYGAPFKTQVIPVETNNSINQIVIEKGLFCPNCGKKMDRQSVFCGNCGYKF